MTHQTIFQKYDQRADTLREWAREHYIREFGLTPGTLLDVGCGNGFWSGIFAAEGFTVRGIDHDTDYLAEAINKYPGIRFGYADIGTPLLFSETFDVVFCRTLPQFFQPTLEPAAALVANLRPHVDGTLLVSVYSDGSGRDRPQISGELARYHPDAAIVAAIEAGGMRVTHAARVGNYFQVGAAPA